jgi:hypothetical protein
MTLICVAMSARLGVGIIEAHGSLAGLRREHDPREQLDPLSSGEADEWMRIFWMENGET